MIRAADDEDATSVPENYNPEITTSFAYLYGDVNNDTITPIIKFITTCNVMHHKLPSINLLINSGGGDLHHAFALISVMKASIIPVNTIAIGEVKSSALMIAMAGHKRYVDKHCEIMSHMFSMSHPEAKASEMKYKNREVNLTIKRMVDFYEQVTGLPKQKIRRNLLPNHDVYLSVEQALTYNMFDGEYDSMSLIFKPGK
jgi:ATP-dependent protease ClpP protease subunit